jgi:hypothetical protein
MIYKITHCNTERWKKKGFQKPKYNNTKTYCKMYYVEDLLYFDYQSWQPEPSAMSK